jgi:hypothetical protein
MIDDSWFLVLGSRVLVVGGGVVGSFSVFPSSSGSSRLKFPQPATGRAVVRGLSRILKVRFHPRSAA